MLRLRPSEITLTPIDVEETRRRMAQNKQQPAPPTIQSSLSSYPHRGPRLRRGAVRSRDAAINHLGNIPVLTPHQVIHTSTDSEPADDQPDPEDVPRERSGVDGLSDAVRSPELPEVPAEPFSSTPSLVRGLQLPIRPAPPVPARDRLASRENTDADEASTSKLVLGPPSPSQNKISTSEARNEDLANSQLQSSTDGPVEAPHGQALNSHSFSQVQAADGQGGATTPTQKQAQAVSGTGQPHTQSQSDLRNIESKAMPTLLLQGFFVSPGKYGFKESFMVPHTEPRKSSARFASKARTMSCSSEPPQSISETNSSGRDPRQPGDVFWSAETAQSAHSTDAQARETTNAEGQPEIGKPRSSFEERLRRVHTRLESIHGRTRGFFGRSREGRTDQNSDEHLAPRGHPRSSEGISEASSNSSLPYSYYELPASRHSSREGSHSHELPQSQFDGAAPSRQSVRGAYFSIRPSQVHVKSDISHPPLTRVSSFSSPDLTSMLGQHGLSPRPASPYTRQEGTQDASQPPEVLITSDDFVGPHRDAASAAARDLSSPLDLIAQRAYAQLAQAPSLFPTTQQYQGPGITSVFQYHVQDVDSEQRRPRQSGAGTMRQESGNSAHYRMQTGRPPGDARTNEPSLRRHERSSTNTSEPQTHTYRRTVHAGRAGHRSSENVPVGVPVVPPLPHTLPPPRISQIQPHRVSFGGNQRPRTSQGISLRGGDVPAPPVPSIRFNAPRQYGPSTRDGPPRGIPPPQARTAGRRINRSLDGSNNMISSSPGPPINARRSSQRQNQGAAGRVRRSITSSGTHSSDSESVMRRYPAYAGDIPSRAHFDRRSQVRASAIQHQPQRTTVGLTSIQHANNRRPPIPVRVASRRVSARQRNQENEGEVEAELMREELGHVGMRYGGEGGGGEVLDETPPRIGRFERRMLDN